MAFDPLFIYGNYVEAGFWTALAGVVAFRLKDMGGLFLAGALLAFGASDLVETRTGGWYTPWWMLAWKTGCVLMIVVLGLPRFLRARRRRNGIVRLTRFD